MKQRGWCILAAALVASFFIATPAEADSPIVLIGQSLAAPGIVNQHWGIPGSDMWVAQLDPTASRLQLVEARDAVANGTETVSDICQRTSGCVDAVNGDFFDLSDGQPIGGVIIGDHMWRSPSTTHEQLSLAPLRITQAGLGDDSPGWAGVVSDGFGYQVPLSAVNWPGGSDGTVLYTNHYGTTTPSCSCTEIIGDRAPSDAAAIGQPLVYQYTGSGHGGTPLGPGRVVIAGFGSWAGRLSSWQKADLARTPLFKVSIETAQPSSANIGGHPWLLQNGQAWPYDPGQAQRDPMLKYPYPRTVVAWQQSNGKVSATWLIVADGSDRKVGLTIDQMLGFLQNQLHATDAIALDGGGSSTFAVHGQVASTPADGHERPVDNAIVAISSPSSPAVKPQARSPLPRLALGTAKVTSTPAVAPAKPAPSPTSTTATTARPPSPTTAPPERSFKRTAVVRLADEPRQALPSLATGRTQDWARRLAALEILAWTVALTSMVVRSRYRRLKRH